MPTIKGPRIQPPVEIHTPDGKCCEGSWPVRLGADLYDRMRGRPYYSPNEYAAAMAEYGGQIVQVLHRFYGPGGVYAFTLRLPNGQSYHCPCLYCEIVTPKRYGAQRESGQGDRPTYSAPDAEEEQ